MPWVSLELTFDPLLSSQALLFNPAKPFWKGAGSQNADVELMMDCFVSCFRLNPHNNHHFKVNCVFAALVRHDNATNRLNSDRCPISCRSVWPPPPPPPFTLSWSTRCTE